MTDTIYEVFAISAYGSDVVEKDTLEQARKCAEEWSNDNKKTMIMVNKVTRERVCIFENGKEVTIC